ncbi:Protein lin-10 isoform 1 [Schistosoma japonicum]|uniref:Protein lin-10 isoform 1 n=1 Tax=Schistosoma japonicum TaxID=6182 RepID=A0A4Z2CUZ5_SCHJA|nr:Protein lin-10 isoform 1 [Schistosoma japonicum]
MSNGLSEKNWDSVQLPVIANQSTLHMKRNIITMPTVEDGLSSGSDSGSLCSGSRSRLNGCSFNMRSSSGSPDSVTDIYCGRPPMNSCSGSPNGEHLLNPNIVQDISNDIRDIKRTLSAVDHAKAYIPSCDVESTGNMNILAKQNSIKNSSEPNHCHCKEAKIEFAQLESSHTDDFHVSNHNWDKFKEVEKVTHTVHTVVECTNDGNTNEFRNGNILKSPIDSYSHKQMHHWTFPSQSNTVCSSSDEEKCSRTNTKAIPYKSQIKSQNNINARRTNPCSPSSSCENSQQNKFKLSTNSDHSGALTNKLNGKNSTHANVTSNEINKSPLLNHSSRRDGDFDSDEDTAQLLDKQYQADKQVYIPELKDKSCIQTDRQRRVREVSVRHPDQPDVLIHGLLFRAQYMGSTQILCNKQSTRMSRMLQAQEVVNRIKTPDDESHPSVTVELFVSTERIMILNSNLEDILIDHTLRTVSYIADIGDLFVLMSRRLDQTQSDQSEDTSPTCNPNEQEENRNCNANNYNSDGNATNNYNSAFNRQHSVTPLSSTISEIAKPTAKSTMEKLRKPMKMICHVLESTEAQLIAQTVGHAFQLAYLDFLRQNGIEDLGIIKQLDYDDVMKQQEIFCDELSLFCDKDNHKEVTIPKQKGEALGVVIVESGWGSLLPTALLANMHPTGPAARCGQLNIGNQIVAVNGQSLVGLPLLTCQQIIKNCRQCTIVKLMIICCPPVVEVLIRRPSLNYQLGFSVQDGVICSLLRGGIAERGGIRVDHRIIEINGESVVAVSHEKIVQLLATSVGEIHIRTMPTSVFRLLTGQIIPRYI